MPRCDFCEADLKPMSDYFKCPECKAVAWYSKKVVDQDDVRKVEDKLNNPPGVWEKYERLVGV